MSDHYNQPELANLYDDENVWDASADFYLDLREEETRSRIRDKAVSVWLKADPEVIMRRVRPEGRPAFGNVRVGA